jgi:hypothetical protein
MCESGSARKTHAADRSFSPGSQQLALSLGDPLETLFRLRFGAIRAWLLRLDSNLQPSG